MSTNVANVEMELTQNCSSDWGAEVLEAVSVTVQCQAEWKSTAVRIHHDGI